MPSHLPEPPSGATRDEAIAAAREEYGSDVRIRGVRRIRTGGVAGFFSQERYVADVVLPTGRTDAGRPAVTAPAGTPVKASAKTPAKPAGKATSKAPAKTTSKTTSKATAKATAPAGPQVAPARVATPVVVAEVPPAGCPRPTWWPAGPPPGCRSTTCSRSPCRCATPSAAPTRPPPARSRPSTRSTS